MSARPWWRDAVIYQVYPRSFADANGDGLGDLPGIISRLDYLAALGIDAIWVSPFYTSPQHDAGYDVADFRDVDPRFGTLDDADALITGAHKRGLKVLFDIVPNHTSSEHRWWQEVLRDGPGSAAWDRYIIRPSDAGPPNNWTSVFHGPAWTKLITADGSDTGYWYLHLFDSTQPDVNWENAEVREEFADILRFWFDRGVDGFRIDVAHGMVKDPALPDVDYAKMRQAELLGSSPEAPYWDQDGVHDVYREWRRIADSYDPPRIFCGETWAPSPERLALYQRPDELHTSFNFDYLKAGWDRLAVQRSVANTLTHHATVGAPPTWVLSNHDVVRHRTRLAPGFFPQDRHCRPDETRGLARARALTLFTLALPGSTYLYQGEELGLVEVFDIPDDAREDPAWHRSHGEDLGRDGCRVPLPWSGDVPSYGFNSGVASWLPQPPTWASLSAQAQEGLGDSTLEFYRAALALRRARALGEAPLEWWDTDGDLLAFRRAGATPLMCVINFGQTPAILPSGTVEIASMADAVVPDHRIAGESCVWMTPS